MGVAVAAGLVLKALQPLVLVWQTRVQAAEAAVSTTVLPTEIPVPGGLGLWSWRLVRLLRKPATLGSSLSRGRRRRVRVVLQGRFHPMAAKQHASSALQTPPHSEETDCAPAIRLGITTTQQQEPASNVVPTRIRQWRAFANRAQTTPGLLLERRPAPPMLDTTLAHASPRRRCLQTLP